jgi:hypothetical protein
MGYKYIVKSYRWENGTLRAVNAEFIDEQHAIDYANAVNPAETVKIYVQDELIYSATVQPSASYA